MSNIFNKKFDLEFIMLQGPKGEPGEKGEPGKDGSGASYELMTQEEAVDGTSTVPKVIDSLTLRNAIITDDEYLYLAIKLATVYSPSVLYDKGIFVTKDNNMYQRKEDMTASESWTESNWLLIAKYSNGAWHLV